MTYKNWKSATNSAYCHQNICPKKANLYHIFHFIKKPNCYKIIFIICIYCRYIIILRNEFVIFAIFKKIIKNIEKFQISLTTSRFLTTYLIISWCFLIHEFICLSLFAVCISKHNISNLAVVYKKNTVNMKSTLTLHATCMEV